MDSVEGLRAQLEAALLDAERAKQAKQAALLVAEQIKKETQAALLDAERAKQAKQAALLKLAGLTKSLEDRSIFYRGLPRMAMWRASNSSNLGGKHAAIKKIVVQELQLFTLPEPNIEKSIVWNCVREGTIRYSELDVQMHIRNVLSEVISIFWSSLKIGVMSGVKIAELSPDFWIVAWNGIPIGVVEVKLPREQSIANDSNAHGQLYDYMWLLRSVFGVEDVFGILTTYDEWRVCWLPDCDEAATRAFSPEEESTPDRVLQRFDTEIPQNLEQHDATSTTLEEGGDAAAAATLEDEATEEEECNDRRLYASAVYRYDDQNLVRVLACTIRRMAATETRRLDKFSGQAFAVFSPSAWTWARAKFDGLQYKVGIPESNCTKFFLLQRLGVGKDGRVWLASSQAGTACVLKFPNDGTVKEELQIWEKIYGDFFKKRIVGSVVLNQQDAIIMPYFKPVGKEDREQFRSLVEEHIRYFAERGFNHKDLHWRHVASYKTSSGKIGVVFLDLHDVVEIPADKKIEAAEEMREHLNRQKESDE